MPKRAAVLKQALDYFNEHGTTPAELLAEMFNPRSSLREMLHWIEAQEPLMENQLPRDGDSIPDEALPTSQAKDDGYHRAEIIRLLSDPANPAKRRTQLSFRDKDVAAQVIRHFKAITKSTQAELIDDGFLDTIEHALKNPEESALAELDQHYSTEIIDKLPLIVERASKLSHLQISPQEVVPPDVERYFTEAHQCYLYGFPVACAVLCRAILEAILKMKVSGKFEDLPDRIEAAHECGLLSQERRVWAYEVKDMGRWAIHHYERFAKGDRSDKVEEGLLKTRAIVEELLAARGDSRTCR